MAPDSNEIIRIYSAGMVEISPAAAITEQKKREAATMRAESKAKKDSPAESGSKPNKKEIRAFTWNAQDNLKKALYKTAPNLKWFVTLSPADKAFSGCSIDQDFIDRGRKIAKKIKGLMEKEGVSGFIRIELEVRRTGTYKGRTLPHYHLALDEAFKRIHDIWLGSRRPDRPGHHFHCYDARPIQENSTAWIDYLCKPNSPKAMANIAGPYPEKDKYGRVKASFSIGRSWFKIGNPQEEKVEGIPLNPIEGRQYRKLLKKAVAAQVRTHSKGDKKLSKGRALSLGNQSVEATVYIGKENALKLLELAKELAQTKQPPKRCALDQHDHCQGWAAEGEIFCPHCLQTNRGKGISGRQGCQEALELRKLIAGVITPEETLRKAA